MRGKADLIGLQEGWRQGVVDDGPAPDAAVLAESEGQGAQYCDTQYRPQVRLPATHLAQACNNREGVGRLGSSWADLQELKTRGETLTKTQLTKEGADSGTYNQGKQQRCGAMFVSASATWRRQCIHGQEHRHDLPINDQQAQQS